MTEFCENCPARVGRAVGMEVVGDGPPAVIFVADSPGKAELALGRPMVGPFGQVVRALADHYGGGRPYALTNVTSCRPPEGREASCILHCRTRLDLEISNCLMANPECNVVALGATATRVLTGHAKITEVDGCWVQGIGMCLNSQVLCLSITVARQWADYPAFEQGFAKAFNPPQCLYIPTVPFTLLTPQRMKTYLTGGWGKDVVAVDIECGGEDKEDGLDFKRGTINCIGIATADETFIIPREVIYAPVCREFLCSIFENPRLKVGGHNFKFDVRWLMTHLGVPYRCDWDTILAHYTLVEAGLGRSGGGDKDTISKGHGLKLLLRRYLNIGEYNKDVEFNPTTPEGWKKLYEYCAVDAWATRQLHFKFKEMQDNEC